MKREDGVLDIKNLFVTFSDTDEPVEVLHDVNLSIGKGETVGIVGESGCGKSMLALAVMGLIRTPPGAARGEILLEGRDLLSLSSNEMVKLRGNEISMIFQEPMTSLNPVMTIGDQLSEVFRFHQGAGRAKAREGALQMLRKVNITLPEERLHQYPHELSGGMRQRVMIAMALACNPKVLIADEPTTALDVTIQAQILALMKRLARDLGTSIMFITHDLAVVGEICSRAVIFYCGRIVEEIPAEGLFRRPSHPYTQGLLASLPQPGRAGKLYVIPGSVPDPKDFPKGCVFHPRCQFARDICTTTPPPFMELAPGHRARCWLYDSSKGDGAP